MRAIPTFYDRIEYRSRLEARWAAFFDQLGWQCIYEPFDADHYIPDFIIHGDGPLLVEIKPVVTQEEYKDVLTEVDRKLGDDDGAWLNGVVVFGVSPLPYAGYYLADRVASISGEAGWYRCPSCGAFAIEWHPRTVQQWRRRSVQQATPRCRDRHYYAPCGHLVFGDHMERIDPDVTHQLWATACNNVKWRGRDA